MAKEIKKVTLADIVRMVSKAGFDPETITFQIEIPHRSGGWAVDHTLEEGEVGFLNGDDCQILFAPDYHVLLPAR